MVRILSIIGVEIKKIKSNPSQLMIVANGFASTSGWKNIALDASADKNPDDDVLELYFVGEKPNGVVLQVLTPVSATYIYDGEDADDLAAVIVKAGTNEISKRIVTADEVTSLEKNKFTTLALGEEEGSSQSFTTFALGEEGPFTNPRLDDPTTSRFGEEGPITDPRIDDPTTWRFGEEGPITSPRFDDPTTLRLGEEGPTTDPRIDDPTTWRFGEEGPITSPRFDDPKTAAIGEEGPITDPGFEDPFRGGGFGGGGGPFGGF